MKEDKILVGNIQRFCVNDGPGIRTTVFLKGCSLKCPWCSNPENIKPIIEYYIENELSKSFGKYYSSDELFNLIMKDILYYDSDGGVTFSGGEPLLQSKRLIYLLKKLRKENINICFETSLNVANENLIDIIDYVDLFYVDIKILDKNVLKSKLNGNIDNYYKNIETLFKNNKKIIFRIPLVYEYTYTKPNTRLILNFLKKYKPVKVEIFSVHNLGEKKYKLLDLNYQRFNKISGDDLTYLCNSIKKLNIDCTIEKI